METPSTVTLEQPRQSFHHKIALAPIPCRRKYIESSDTKSIEILKSNQINSAYTDWDLEVHILGEVGGRKPGFGVFCGELLGTSNIPKSGDWLPIVK
jgi:hypothetical protein